MLQQRNWLPSRWFYAAAGALFGSGIVLADIFDPDWLLLVAAACAAGTTVLWARIAYDPQANDEPPDGPEQVAPAP
jgi:hypothetical protein